MQVELNRLEQVFSLDDKKMKTFLVFTLPNGQEISATLSDDDSEAVVAVVMGAPEEVEDPISLPFPEADDEESLLPVYNNSVPEEAETVEWMTLPDNVLPIELKRYLIESGAPEELTVNEMQERLAPMLSQVPRTRTADIPQHRLVDIPRSRTVDSDEMGNPLVHQTVQTSMTEDDEDGVAQL